MSQCGKAWFSVVRVVFLCVVCCGLGMSILVYYKIVFVSVVVVVVVFFFFCG